MTACEHINFPFIGDLLGGNPILSLLCVNAPNGWDGKERLGNGSRGLLMPHQNPMLAVKDYLLCQTEIFYSLMAQVYDFSAHDGKTVIQFLLCTFDVSENDPPLWLCILPLMT